MRDVPNVVVKRAELACSPTRAFSLFTEHAGAWWPADRRHTNDAASTVRIEASGRFYERANDGTEVELGIVREFVPARRLVLDWYPGTGPTAPTRVEVTFVASDVGTSVTVRHGPGIAGDELFTKRVSAYDRSWDLVLAALETAAETASA